MTTPTTIIWRAGILTLLIAAVPAGMTAYEHRARVDTDAMLDVSVSIRTISHVRIDEVGDSVWESGSGSGFLVSAEDCLLWTNHHVVANAAMIEVYPRRWERAAGIPATLVGSTPRADLAIVRMESCEGIPEAVLGESALVHVGDESYAVGNPLGRNPDSISRGIISHTARFIDGTIPHLQTDAAINPGNSGGALFDRHGAVIGINTAIATGPLGGNVGVGYSVPIDVAKQTAIDLQSGTPSWGNAGIRHLVSPLTSDEAEIFGVPNGHAAIVLTGDPHEGPGADKLFKHDVIHMIGERPVSSASQAMGLINGRRAGDILTFHLVRGGEHAAVDITLVEGWQAEESRSADFFEGLLGMTVEMWDRQAGERGRFKTPVITKVQSLGPAHLAHISSSQKTVAFNGGFLMPYQLDVKTVTGVVSSGLYHGVSTIEDLERLAAKAFGDDQPVLLEIEVWARSNPRDPRTELEHRATVFYKVVPAVSSASSPYAAPTTAASTAPGAAGSLDAPAGGNPRSIPATMRRG